MARGRPHVESKGLSHLEATRDLFVSGNLNVTGSSNFRNPITSNQDHLILSSSAGSKVTISGNLDVRGDGDVNIVGNLIVGGTTTTISSSNLLVEDPLIVLALSQSVAPQFDAGFVVERGTGENVSVLWDESANRFALIQTDETGSTSGNVSINGYSDLKAEDLVLHSGTLTADNTHLILSSSAGSKVTVSGTLLIPGGLSNRIGIGISSPTTLLDVRSASPTPISWGSLSSRKANLTWNANVAIIRAETANELSLGANGTNHLQIDLTGILQALAGHMILSSSAGSIVHTSASLKLGQYTSVALPAGSDTLSGSVIWVSDIKSPAIYGPEGWTRVLTGSTI